MQAPDRESRLALETGLVDIGLFDKPYDGRWPTLPVAPYFILLFGREIYSLPQDTALSRILSEDPNDANFC